MMRLSNLLRFGRRNDSRTEWLRGLWLMAATASAVGPTCLLLFDGDICGIPLLLRLPIAIAAWWAAWWGWTHFSPTSRRSPWRVGGFRSVVTSVLCTSLLIWSCCMMGPRSRDAQTLSYCVQSDDTAMLKKKLADGADPNGRVPRGPLSTYTTLETPLCIAAILGRDDCIQILLEAGADVNAGDSLSLSPLAAAAREDQWHTAMILLSHGANPNDSATGESSALQRAVAEENLNMVYTLLSHGANPHSEGDSLVHNAPAGPIRDALLNAGAAN